MKVLPRDVLARWLARTGFTYRQFAGLVARDENTVLRQLHGSNRTPHSLALWLQRVHSIEVDEDFVTVKLKRISEPVKR